MSSVTRRDYYEILGVERESDDGVIKTAYRKLALQYHPDRNPGSHEAEERFKECAEAYSVLSDPQKRAAYNRFGHQGVPTAAGNGGFDASGFPDLGDILSDVFGFGDVFGRSGQGQKRTRAQRGEDVRYDLEIGFEDSMRGLSVDIQVPRMEACGRCHGKRGARRWAGHVPDVPRPRRGDLSAGVPLVRRTCSQCNGRGQIIRRPCKECRGEGYLRRERKLKVNLPAGVDNGTQLRLSQEGQPGANGGPAGDLYVVLKVGEHPIFERHESDLHCTVPINIGQAALGASIDILTFDGLQTIKIPEGSQAGSRLRLKGLGVPHLNSTARGDLYVHLDVKVPSKLTREQRKLFEQLRDLLPVENEPQEKGIFDKVKDYFL